MNLNELKIRIAEVLGVSDSEKELAFEIFIYNTFNVLDTDETLKIPRIGFFQFKIKPFKISGTVISHNEFDSKNTIVFSPLTEDLSSGARAMFLTIDVPHQKKDLFELDESVFSISVGKPILPVSSDSKNGGDNETSYVLLKKSIEERVGEIISESEHLKNFDIWEDHLSSIDIEAGQQQVGVSSTIYKLTDDIEYTEEEINNNFVFDEDKEIKTSTENSTSGSIDDDEPISDDMKLPRLKNDFAEATENHLDKKSEKDMKEEESNDEDFPSFENYDDSKNDSEEITDDLSKLEIDDKKEFNIFPDHPVRKPKNPDKFWGMDDFKSTSEIHDNTGNQAEDDAEENLDWDWGDELLEGDDEDSINVDDFDKDENDVEVFSEKDEEKSTNLFIQLEKSLTGEESTFEDKDEQEMENVLIEDQIVKDDEDDKVANFKSTYIRNLLIVFGVFAVIVISIFIFVSPGSDAPTQRTLPPTQDEASTEIVTRQPVAAETETTVDEIKTPVSEQNQLDENPIEERTRLMQQPKTASPSLTTPSPSTINPESQPSVPGELYRNIPGERSVRGLIFTDGVKFFVQVSSWPNKVKAETEANRLRRLGYDAFIVEAYIQKYRATWYRVKIGYFNSATEADRFLQNTKF